MALVISFINNGRESSSEFVKLCNIFPTCSWYFFQLVEVKKSGFFTDKIFESKDCFILLFSSIELYLAICCSNSFILCIFIILLFSWTCFSISFCCVFIIESNSSQLVFCCWLKYAFVFVVGCVYCRFLCSFCTIFNDCINPIGSSTLLILCLSCFLVCFNRLCFSVEFSCCRYCFIVSYCSSVFFLAFSISVATTCCVLCLFSLYMYFIFFKILLSPF
mmetsp:Transcript_8978/g.13309  ORF Transcript_8978/g.13309 Transcript_8978/m.13309 type:complete len:219 (-) Transcript_8978:56-712(-)